MKVICAFSSDRRTLYKADIYRVLALPVGHIVHFRYKKRYVEQHLLDSDGALNDQPVAIFFTQGNAAESEANELTHTSIRWATISRTEVSPDTNVFHVYLKLGKFCDIAVNTGDTTLSTFFCTLEYTESNEEASWESRINKVKDAFPQTTFFHLDGIWKDGCGRLPVRYSRDRKSCRYDLIHGDRYILKLALGNPDSSTTKIELSDSNNELIINCINPLETSAQFDDYDIPVSVKTLQVKQQPSLLTFNPVFSNKDNRRPRYKNPMRRDVTRAERMAVCCAKVDSSPAPNSSSGEYATNIELNLKFGFKPSIAFGLLSTTAASAILLVTPIPLNATVPPFYQVGIAAVAFALATGSLFYFFNKK